MRVRAKKIAPSRPCAPAKSVPMRQKMPPHSRPAPPPSRQCMSSRAGLRATSVPARQNRTASSRARGGRGGGDKGARPSPTHTPLREGGGGRTPLGGAASASASTAAAMRPATASSAAAVSRRSASDAPGGGASPPGPTSCERAAARADAAAEGGPAKMVRPLARTYA